MYGPTPAASRVVTAILVVMLLIGISSPAPAQARVGLMPGTMLHFVGGGSCSLGFLATNAVGDRLAVTAGHCPDSLEQKVVAADGTPVGRVVHYTPDDTDHDRFGVTLIQLYRNTYIADGYFARFGDPVVGEAVRKYGARTSKTMGKIVSVTEDPDDPRHSKMEATMVTLPGDSGSAWVGDSDDGPTLLGLHVGSTRRPDGGFGFAYGFPIRNLIEVVQERSPNWGVGFAPIGRG